MTKETCSECGEEFDDTECTYIIELDLNEHQLEHLDIIYLCEEASIPYSIRRKHARKRI